MWCALGDMLVRMTMPPPTARVLAAVIEHDGRYLLGRRPAEKRHGGLWEFPGGKVEVGETDAEAMARELREELDLTLVTLGAQRFVARDGTSPFEIVFVDTIVRGTPRALEHSALAWISPAKFSEYVLAPSDQVFAQSMVRALRDD